VESVFNLFYSFFYKTGIRFNVDALGEFSMKGHDSEDGSLSMPGSSDSEEEKKEDEQMTLSDLITDKEALHYILVNTLYYYNTEQKRAWFFDKDDLLKLEKSKNTSEAADKWINERMENLFQPCMNLAFVFN
jgi:hypothetical protein